MPWICRQGGNGWSDEDLSDEEWKRLDRILNAHGTPIIDEDDSGVRIDAIPSAKAQEMTKDLHRWGFDWVNGTPGQSA